MNRFYMITNVEKDIGLQTTNIIRDYLEQKGKEVFFSNDASKFNIQAWEDSKINQQIDCAIILGGDGTIIQSARELAIRNIPIIGVNLGTLGFLAEIEKREIIPALDNLLAGNYEVESRMMLQADIFTPTQHKHCGIGLNDAVISRSGLSRIVELEIYVNNELMDIYKADGVIVSTPTGSTAYNLSAGGPVVIPTTAMMVITPVCPHSLNARSVVVSGEDEVIIKIGKVRKTSDINDVVLTLDGQVGFTISQGDKINISMAPYKTKLIKLRNMSFYKILREKIGFQEKELRNEN